MGLRSLIAVALASGAALLLNRAAAHGARPGPRLAFLLGPGVEEAAKTGFALALGAPVVAVHLGFGAAEAVYDASGRRASWSGPGLAAGAMSVVSHAAFGVVTQVILALARQPLLAVLGAAVVHALWNVAIVALVDVGRRP